MRSVGSFAKRLIPVVVLLSLGISLTTIFGLVAGKPILPQWIPGTPGMVLDTALSVLLGSMGLWLVHRHNKPWLVRSISGSLVLLCCLNLILSGRGAVLQRFFLLKDTGHMQPATIVSFLLIGIGLLLPAPRKASVSGLWAFALLGSVSSSIGLITLLGYASGLNATSWWNTFFLEMSIPTAVTSFALGLGLIAFSFQPAKRSQHHFSIALAVAACFSMLLLFTAIDAVWASSNAVAAAQLQVRLSSDQIASLNRLLQNVRRAETGQRGYLLTGDSGYLRDFYSGREGVDQSVRSLGSRDSTLLETVRLKSDELSQTVLLESQGRHQEALAIVNSSVGIGLMGVIDARVQAILVQLHKELSVRMQDSQVSFSSLHKIILWCFGSAALFAAGALLLVTTEMRRRARTELGFLDNEAKLAAMNTELQRQTDRAEEANRAKSTFLASMSHEIRTPMNAILGMADMLWESDLSRQQRHYVEIFRRAGGNLLALINDILDLSKIESGNFVLRKEDFDLSEVVEQVVEILTPKAESKNLSLRTQIDFGTTAKLIGDPERLRQVILNLLGNAVKFTAKGEVVLRVSSRSSVTQAELEFAISDTGIGIPEDKLAAIFDDFTQAESSTTRQFGGTGLGLGISRRLVSHMGGTLQVRSELGRGSTFLFNVTLPVGEGQTDWAPTESVDLSGGRVLIVDNSTTDRVILTEMCTAMKMMVTSCGTGSEAVELTRTSLMENRPFAMALVDRMMPAMDGFETAIYMHGLQPDLGIVMISSELHSADIDRIRDLGFCGHLLKPIRRTELLQLLSKCRCHATTETPGGTSASIAASSPSNPTRVRTLAAEDSEDNRFLLEAYCGGSIYDLTFAFNGQRALEMLTSETFDIVIMDVQMPVMDGLTATTKIRDLEAARGSKRIPIIAMTANALQEDVTKALDAGCDAHISKPVSKKLFLNALDQWHSVSKMSGSAQVT